MKGRLRKESTVWLEQDLIDRPERYAEASGKSISQIVADYFAVLDRKATVDVEQLPPITRSLSGILKGENVDEENYYVYLEEKYSQARISKQD